MPETLIEKAKRLAAAAARKAEAAKESDKDARAAKAKERKAKAEIERQTAWVIGKSIAGLVKAGKLTPQQHKSLGEILMLMEDKPHNWELIADYLPPARPISRNPAEQDAA